MATPRPPFPYTSLSRAVRSCQPTTYCSLRTPPPSRATQKANFYATRHSQQEAYSSRYGQAVSPSLPPPPKPSESRLPQNEQDSPKQSRDEIDDDAGSMENAATKPDSIVEPEDRSDENQEGPPEERGPLQNKELDMVLSVPSPSEVKGRTPRHPHLEPPPYEHHFDTYSLVQQLAAKDAYTQYQAITLMKAIRKMLAMNLDMAKEGLVSKSNIENESYLFRAACSELKTTLQTTRHSETLTQRSQRAQLQHEFDILNQKVTQDLTTLREELKGMFNDRKMSLEEEKRKIDSKIQDLNYEITVLLHSEAKSQVEGLRWILTRRAVMAIGLSALMIISALKYFSVKTREKEEAEKKKAAAEKALEERAETRYPIPSKGESAQADSGRPSVDYEESLG